MSVKARIYFDSEAPFPWETLDVVASYNITKRDFESALPYMEVRDARGNRHTIVKEYIASVMELGDEKLEAKQAAEPAE